MLLDGTDLLSRHRTVIELLLHMKYLTLGETSEKNEVHYRCSYFFSATFMARHQATPIGMAATK